jgi:hypothetical protein
MTMSVLDAVRPARVANTDRPSAPVVEGTTYTAVVPPTTAGQLDAVIKASGVTVGTLLDVWIETSIDGIDGWEVENQLHRLTAAGTFRLPCGHVDKYRRWGVAMSGTTPGATLEIKTLHGGGAGQIIRSRRWYGVVASGGGFIGNFPTGGAKHVSVATFTNPGSVTPWLGINVVALPDQNWNFATALMTIAAPTAATAWGQGAPTLPVAHPNVRLHFASGASGAGNKHDIHAFATS